MKIKIRKILKQFFCNHKYSFSGLVVFNGRKPDESHCEEYKCTRCNHKKYKPYTPSHIYGFHPTDWSKMCKEYEAKTGEKADPELDAQKIYSHWLQSYK